MEFYLKNILLIWILTILSVSQVKSDCRYRTLELPKEIFQYWASWGCYIYTLPDFFIEAPMKLETCSLYLKSTTHYVPGINQEGFCHPFHYTSEFVVQQVDKSFQSNRTLTRWVECTKEAEDCCADVMDTDEASDFGNRCPSIWDGWSCFRSIPTGQNYKMPCPRYAYGIRPSQCHRFSYKMCYPNGTWNQQTDYSPCDVTPPLIARNQYYIVILSISTLFCTPALLILVFTKAANSRKLKIIRALLLVIFIHNLMVILVRAIIIMPELTTSKPKSTPMRKNSVLCRSLTVLEKLTGNIVFGFMLLIGISLYQRLKNVYRIHDRTNGATMLPFYIGVGIISVASVSWWATLMAMYSDHNCWLVSDDFSVDWILDGPRLGMLCVNLILLLHITIRLWHAFNAKESENSPFLRALRAALICVPIFGMQFLFLIIRPDMDNCGTEQFYYFTSYTVYGAQGVSIAIFHCYTEREVSKYFSQYWGKVKNVWRKDSIVSKCSTSVNETQQELVNNVLTPRNRSTNRSRRRSLSI